MEEKNFRLLKNGDCDDATEDTVHEISVVYIESTNFTDSNSIIGFKFIDACCQEFLGDYSIENDTLEFRYEQVNEEVCDCLCWYRYKLILNEPRAGFMAVKIKEIKSK